MAAAIIRRPRPAARWTSPAWDLDQLTFTPTANGTYTLTATVTEQDADGQISTSRTATEHVSVIAAPYIISNDQLGPNTVRPADVLSAVDNGVPTGTSVTYQWFSSADGYHAAIGTGATYAVATWRHESRDRGRRHPDQSGRHNGHCYQRADSSFLTAGL